MTYRDPLIYDAGQITQIDVASDQLAYLSIPTSAFHNGTFRESFDFRCTSNGTAITGTLEKSGGGDLTLQFSDGYSTLNCTPAQTINIPPGTDSVPIGYFVYIPQSTKTLTVNTTSWPSGEHIKVAYVYVPSAAFVQDHGGAYINQNWNDHLAGTDNQGHLAHLCQKIRSFGAKWYSGVAGNGTDTYFSTPNTGNTFFSCESGVISQMHPQSFTSVDTANGDVIVVHNDPDTPYRHVSNLQDLTKDSTGNTISTGQYFSIVFHGIANKTGQWTGIVASLPGGTYTNLSDAQTDVDAYDDYNLSRAFEIESGCEFLICRAIFRKAATSWTWQETEDLRGKVPSNIAGGGGGGASGDHGSLSGLADDDHTQYVLADGTRAFTGNVTVNASINATGYIYADGNMSCNVLYTNGNIVCGGTVSGAAASFPQISSATGTINCTDDDIVTTGNLTANRLTINTVNSGAGTGNVTFSGNIVGVSTYYGTSVNVSSTVNCNYLAAGILVQTPSLTSVTGTINCADDHIVTTGNVTGNVANFTTANLSGYLEGYAGSPSNNDVLTWVTANSRAEFKTPVSGSGGATITANTTYYLDPTGNDTTGDGTANNPWFTINRAYEALANETIAGGVKVTIQLNDGTYNYTSTVTPDHPQSAQITVSGTTVYTLNSTNLVSVSGTAPNRSMVLTVDDTSNCAVGDIIEIRNAANGTYGVLINGATQITSVNTSNSTITCNFFQGSTTYAPTGAITANIVGHKTMVTFNGCNGFLAQNSNQINVDKIGFDGVDLGYTLFYAYGTSKIYTTSNDVNAIRFINGAQALYGGYIRCEYASFGYCARGLYAGYGGIIQASRAQVSGATLLGANAVHGSYIGMDYVFIIGGAANGMVVTDAVILASNARFYANVQNGLVVQQGSVAFCDTATIAWNGFRGMLAQFGSYCELSNCNVVSNGDAGVFYYGQSGGRIVSGSITYNGNGGLYCGNNSSCQITSATIANNTSYQMSPTPINTVGNNESFMY